MQWTGGVGGVDASIGTWMSLTLASCNWSPPVLDRSKTGCCFDGDRWQPVHAGFGLVA